VARPHLGLILPNSGGRLDAERLVSTAVAAERAGFDSGWVTDHVVVPPEHAPIYGTISEALVSLGFLAGRTERLKLGVSALVVPQRNPLVALKQLTSLDFLSGRIIGGGAGRWRASSALDADFKSRTPSTTGANGGTRSADAGPVDLRPSKAARAPCAAWGSGWIRAFAQRSARCVTA
jgi:hypothetical protein